MFDVFGILAKHPNHHTCVRYYYYTDTCEWRRGDEQTDLVLVENVRIASAVFELTSDGQIPQAIMAEYSY